jgi:NADH:ubiquinone oxidoreductase subunit 6 (subunit J)
MILLIVYIGAIAILFLFVIMLLNLKKVMPVWQQGFWSKLAAPVFFLFLTERGYAFLSSALYINSYYNSFTLSRNLNSGLAELNQINYFMRYGLSDASIFSDLFYGVHAFAFLATACILTVSMIGSIVLALSATELKK